MQAFPRGLDVPRGVVDRASVKDVRREKGLDDGGGDARQNDHSGVVAAHHARGLLAITGDDGKLALTACRDFEGMDRGALRVGPEENER